MVNSIFNRTSQTLLSLVVLAFLGFGKVNAQTGGYTCTCANMPSGFLSFEIFVTGAPATADYYVDNVINLYRSINPMIPLRDLTPLVYEPGSGTVPGRFVLRGYARDGEMPFVQIFNADPTSMEDFPMNMITCQTPSGEVVGNSNSCVGENVDIEFDFSSLLLNSLLWDFDGATVVSQSGLYGEDVVLRFDSEGTYTIRASAVSTSDCDFSDELIVNVTDASDDMVVDGPDYLCSGAAIDIPYTITNPQMFELIWSSNPAAAITPMTGSGTMVEVNFAGAGVYTLSVANSDTDGCLLSGVEYTVNVVDQIDTLQIIGDTYACLGQVTEYTLAELDTISNLSWSITPNTGVTVSPATGMGDIYTVTYLESGDYTIEVSGDTDDGCTFLSTLDVTVPSAAIGTLACNNTVNVSINNNCILEILPSMILEGEGENDDAYDLVIVDNNTGLTLTDNMLNQDLIGHTFTVSVIEQCGGNSCWGTLTVEDKSIPSIVPFCEDMPIVTTCAEVDLDAENPTGFPDFGADIDSTYNENLGNWIVEGFDNCNPVVLSFEDELLTNDECVTQVVERTWTAIDVNNGTSTSCVVTININLIDANSIVWPFDYDSGLDSDGPGDDDTDGIYPSLDACNMNNETVLLNDGDMWIEDENGNPSPLSTGSPISDAFACPNLQVIGYNDQVIPVCGSSRKILRTWTVWDACDVRELMHTQIITLMDVTAPVCTPPMETQVSSDVHECGGDIVVLPPTVTGECDGFTYEVRYKTERGDLYNPATYTDLNVVFNTDLDRYVIQDVTFDTDSIWVQYIVRDACGNTTRDCFTDFELIDDEQPIPACDFNNVVTLNNDGIGFAGTNTFNDNSWDNCGIYQTVIMKMDDECECKEPKFDFLHNLGEYNGHYYFLSKEKMNGYKAFRLIDALDGYPVVIDSLSEDTWVRNQVNNYVNDSYFIGLSSKDSIPALEWSNQDTSSYRNWGMNEPSITNPMSGRGDYHVVVEEDGSWNVYRRNQIETYYVMELESQCDWSQKVTFCCEDVGQETMVAMRVIDWHGNHNQCMVNVNVLEFEKPFIECPKDTFVDCDLAFDFTDLSRFGSATATDNCGIDTIVVSTMDDSDGFCGRDTIRRTFMARDFASNSASCTQHIILGDQNIFDFADIMWPENDTLDNVCTLEGIDPSITGLPEWDQTMFSCSNITYTYDDLLFYIVEGACQKLVRTWTIVDWCQNNRLWEYNQVIKLTNTVDPEISAQSCADVTITNGISIGACEVRVDSIFGELSEVQGHCDGEAIWSYTLDYFDDGFIDASGTTNNASGNYPYGTHRLTWTVVDACGNSSSCEKVLNIIDHIEPTAYCHGEIVIPISDTLGVEIWASDLDFGSFDNCPQNTVYFSFEENTYVPNYTLTCDDLDPGSNFGNIAIDLWIWDNLDPTLANKSVCTVGIVLQDHGNVCDNVDTGNRVATISGLITTEELEMVDNVSMSIYSPTAENEMMSDDGEFEFSNLEMYDDYIVTPQKDDSYLNGVSTMDLIMIQRHILGIERLDSPYKMIAADVDDSENLSVLDLIELRKLILGIYDELPSNTSWRFVDSDHTFINAVSPFPYPESREFNNLIDGINDANFIGVKIGDVNSNVIPNSSKSNDAFPLTFRSEITDKGNTRVQITSGQDADLAGMQLAFDFDVFNSDLLAVIPMGIEINDEHIAWNRADNGQVLVSWNDRVFSKVNEGEILFELLLSGKKPSLEYKAETKVLKSEVYVIEEGKLLEKNIRSTQSENRSLQFEVLQNIPNPFNDETLIEFILDETGPVTFTVTDQIGRVLYMESRNYNKGKNSIVFNTETINQTGLLYYQIATETQKTTKKMIVIQ